MAPAVPAVRVPCRCLCSVSWPDRDSSSRTACANLREIMCPSVDCQFCRPRNRLFDEGIGCQDDRVIEVRQVPWTATPSTLASHFFAGLEVSPGGVAIRLADGRRSNTALVLFTGPEQARLAAGRHQHQFPWRAMLPGLVGASSPDLPAPARPGLLREASASVSTSTSASTSASVSAGQQRIVTLQVFPGSGKEFIQCAGCECSVAATPLFSSTLSSLKPVQEPIKLPTISHKRASRFRCFPLGPTAQKPFSDGIAVEAELYFSSFTFEMMTRLTDGGIVPPSHERTAHFHRRSHNLVPQKLFSSRKDSNAFLASANPVSPLGGTRTMKVLRVILSRCHECHSVTGQV
ncbi:unnamed protein product [Protopolystoma xenopodis]|uniref:RRM domain-containing protein n=1 Tax=Protopolystoma xenopodis TaxID=117903 RepID=A0A448X0S2_9PLAT|nr:unnamed protein product [Protopolystoma xenopodis]